MCDELTWMPAHAIRDLIAKGEVSPVEVTDHFLGRIEELEPTLHAFQVVDTDAARRQAKAAEQAVLDGDELGPLHGIPVSIKDHLSVKGLPFFDMATQRHMPEAARDDIQVERLRAAGAIIVGTNTEMGSGMREARKRGEIFNWDVEARSAWDQTRVPGLVELRFGHRHGQPDAAARPRLRRRRFHPPARRLLGRGRHRRDSRAASRGATPTRPPSPSPPAPAPHPQRPRRGRHDPGAVGPRRPRLLQPPGLVVRLPLGHRRRRRGHALRVDRRLRLRVDVRAGGEPPGDRHRSATRRRASPRSGRRSSPSTRYGRTSSRTSRPRRRCSAAAAVSWETVPPRTSTSR